MVAEEVHQQEVRTVEKLSWHSAWVPGTSEYVDANLVESDGGYEIYQVDREVHQQILG